MANELLCPSGGTHDFVWLRQTTREESWHNFKTYDVFYCRKCLCQREVEMKKEERRSW